MMPRSRTVVAFIALTTGFRFAFGQADNVESAKKAQEALKAGKEFTNSVGMKLVPIKAGHFLMGSPETEKERFDHEGPVHKVTISRDFFMGANEVTQAQYKAVMGETPSFFKGDDLPVEQVSWEDAMKFCAKLTETEKGRLNGMKYTLPTEAQWEYACRAGKDTPFSIGDGRNLSSDEATFAGDAPYGDAAKGVVRGKTTMVGAFKPNAWGLYDMHGNVWERCLDGKRTYRNQAETDPKGDLGGDSPVIRGGSWLGAGFSCRSADRSWSASSNRILSVGFRVVLVP